MTKQETPPSKTFFFCRFGLFVCDLEGDQSARACLSVCLFPALFCQ
jgi:hypothetical protein